MQVAYNIFIFTTDIIKGLLIKLWHTDAKCHRDFCNKSFKHSESQNWIHYKFKFNQIK